MASRQHGRCLVGVAQLLTEEGRPVKPRSLVGAFSRQQGYPPPLRLGWRCPDTHPWLGRSCQSGRCLVGDAQLLTEEGRSVKPRSLIGAFSRQQRYPRPLQLGWRCPGTARGGRRSKTRILGWSGFQAAEVPASYAAWLALLIYPRAAPQNRYMLFREVVEQHGRCLVGVAQMLQEEGQRRTTETF